MVPPPWVRPAELPRLHHRRPPCQDGSSAVRPGEKVLDPSAPGATAELAAAESNEAGGCRLQAIISLGFVIQCADYSAWGGIAKALEEDVGVSASDLAMLLMAERLAMAVSYPFWGFLADSNRRLPIIAAAAGTWACLSFGLASAYRLPQFVAIRIGCGICGGCLAPASQALIGQHFSAEERGKAFGWIAFSYNVGSLLGQSIAVRTQHLGLWGLHGWRSLFIVLGVLCSAFSLLAAHAGASEPLPAAAQISGRPGFLATAARILRVPTVAVIVVQGIFRNAALASLSFLALWVQYLGFSDAFTSVIVACQPLGVLVGCLVAGHLSDAVAKSHPEVGRIAFGQCGDILRLAAVVIVFAMAPRLAEQAGPGAPGTPVWSSTLGLLCGSLFFMGFSQPWAYVGTLRPVLSEVVSKSSVASALAVQKSIEYAGGALIVGPVLGFCTQQLGVDASHDVSGNGNKLAKSEALGRSLLYTLAGCHIMTVTCLWLLYLTYPKDRLSAGLTGTCCDLGKKKSG
eukprot:TRINITY_DN22988_c0_g2_i2.p1 TRINITY_DN22988_c0_g2~~TRINITY_DN22988_c0_g2_i2.p1  ORF type:complete len:515 (-),score=97.38 TRINITY_DN22988_c0_g2_i2:37-1581(-)